MPDLSSSPTPQNLPPEPATPCNPPQPSPNPNPLQNPQPDATSCNLAQPLSRRRKTNPTRRPRPLRPVQLRALALLLQGHRLTLVARHLNISRQTLWRWHHLPQFQSQAQHQSRH